MATQFPNINKWTMNPNIDNELSNTFWTSPTITIAQKANILKYRTGQYMSNAREQVFLGRERFLSIICSICNLEDADTLLHVLLKCNHHHIYAIGVKRHNKAV